MSIAELVLLHRQCKGGVCTVLKTVFLRLKMPLRLGVLLLLSLSKLTATVRIVCTCLNGR